MDSDYDLLIIDTSNDFVRSLEQHLSNENITYKVVQSLSKAKSFLSSKNLLPKLIVQYIPQFDTNTEFIFNYLDGEELASTFIQIITDAKVEGGKLRETNNEYIIDYFYKPEDDKEIIERIKFLLKLRNRELNKIENLKKENSILLKKEKRFVNLLASFPNGLMLMIDRNYRIFFIDGAEMSSLGLIKENIIGRTLNTIFPTNISTRLMTFFDGAWRGNKIQFEFEYKDNTYFTSAASIEEDGSIKHLLITMQNINDKRELEKQVEASEERYRTFFENDLTGDYLSTPEKGVIACNPAFAKIFGYSSIEDVLRNDATEFYSHPSEREEFLKRITKEKIIENFEQTLIRKDGAPVYVVENVVGYFDDKGKLLQFQGFIFDITDIRKAQQAQREADEKLRNIMLNTSNMFYQHDTNHQLIYVSPQVERILGYTPEEAMKKWTEFASDNPINEEGYKKTIEAIKSGKSQGVYELELVHKNGEKVWVEVRETPIIEGDKVTSIVGSLLDITERKKTEEELHETEQLLYTFSDNITDQIFIKDENHRFVYVNLQKARKHSTSPEAMIGKSDFDFFPDSVANKSYQDDVQVIETGEPVINKEELLINKDGESQWVLVSKYPRYDNYGNIIGTMGISRDITERKKAMEDLEKIEWLLDAEETYKDVVKFDYKSPYGDVTTLNTERTIIDNVDKETFEMIATDLMDLLGTSIAVYEKNGDYAYGFFFSGWCRLMDSASRELCDTENNKEALSCGKWLCHENCWNDSSKAAMIKGTSTEIDCVGGIKLFAEPIFVNDEIVGAINIGYGNPPTDTGTLKSLAETYKVDFDKLKKAALEYKPRPPFIFELAKKRTRAAARLIGETIQSSRAEEQLLNQMKELEKFNKIMVGRENKMIELKKEINELYEKLGKQKKYKAPDKL